MHLHHPQRNLRKSEQKLLRLPPLLPLLLSVLHFCVAGSYGWGDGEWMRTWEESCKNDGAELVCDSVICADAPDDEAEAACIELGKALC